MIRRLDLRGPRLPADRRAIAALLPRAELDVSAATEVVAPICADVRLRGAAAVAEYSARFDGIAAPAVRVPGYVIEGALASLDRGVRAALAEAIRRARLVHESQRRPDVLTQVVAGGTVTDRWRPVERVGLYVPGGQAVYPSSVVMNVVPAQVAGVASIAVTSPPQSDHGGWPHPTILAACALLGVQEVYAAGGAQAIAMLAYGVEGCPAVDLVTGPGNAYVAAAKRLLRGVVGIDAEAGPTEIAILADDTADARHVAADLISQAEHDTAAAAVLVTVSAVLVETVKVELDRLVAATKHEERVRAALTGRQSAIVLVDSIDDGLRVVDAYAAEHLEIQTRDARAVADRVRNAGAIFVGPWSPVSLGDYCAGSNHVLPTGGCAAHSSGLSVQTFLRGTQVIEYDEQALLAATPAVTALADAEDLPAHGAAVRERFADRPVHPTVTPRPVEVPLRADLRGRTPYGAPQLDVPVRLNTNENPHPPSPQLVADLVAAVGDAAANLNRYPDREAVALRTDLAGYLRATTGVDLDVEQVWAANGSNEVLQQLLAAFAGTGRAALGFEPSYSMHRTLAAVTGSRWIAGERDGDFGISEAVATAAITRHRPALVFLTSPNNPTGTALGLDLVEAVYDAAQSNGPTIVVVDEAYAEFARPGTPSAVTLLAGRPYLVVTRTMSKAFSLAGARVGYLAADPLIIDALRLVRLPYHLSALTQAAARVAVSYAPELLGSVAAVIEQRDRLVEGVTARGLPVVPSDANFVLVGGLGDQTAVWQGLVERGVLVRDVGLPGHLRVTAGLPHEVDAFLTALDDVMANANASGEPQ